MTPERQEEIRATLEAEDPDFCWALGGYTKTTAKHDYDVKWELLTALYEAQDHIRFLEDAMQRIRDVTVDAARTPFPLPPQG